MAIELSLSWPDKKLSPNGRLCWQAKVKPKQAAYDEAYLRTKENLRCDGIGWEITGVLVMTIVFCKPDKRRRDIDNLLASLKPSIDGIFKALGVDDSRVYEYRLRWGEPVEGGLVKISIEELF